MKKINKKDFINIISLCTPEELNGIILNKSKPRKLVKPIIRIPSTQG